MADAPSVWFGLNIHLAANCGVKGMFEAVLAALEHELGSAEVDTSRGLTHRESRVKIDF